ncbi:MAG: cache domain-containing protein [Campylobacterales bacterium]
MAPKPRLDTFGGKGPLIRLHYLLFSALLIGVALLGLYLNLQVDKNAARDAAHRLLERTLARLEEEKHQARAYAALLAQNPALVRALATRDRLEAVKTVAALSQQGKNDPILSRLRFQVHTAEMTVFVRSWELESYGESLEGFRRGVALVKERKSPVVSVEPGRLLNIKAIAPVFDGDRYVGSVEVIAGFGRMDEALQREGIETAVLMDGALLSVAVDMAAFARLHGFVLAAPAAPPPWLLALEAADLLRLQREGLAQKPGTLYAAAPLFDYDGRFIALIVAARDQSDRRALSLDFFLDRHGRDLPAPPPNHGGLGGYDALGLEALIERRQSVPAHERALFNRALIEKSAAQGHEALLRALLLEEHNKTRSVRIQ